MSSATRAVARRRGALTSVAGLLALLIGAPAALAAVSMARFGSASPLAGVPGPSAWSVRSARDSLATPVRDDTVIDLVLRVSLTAAWVAVLVIVASVVLEVVHLVRHDGLPRPDVRCLGWSQHIARSIASGLLAIAPLSAPAGSLPLLAHSAVLAEPDPLPAPPPAAAVPEDAPPSPEPTDHHLRVVQRGDSVYGIAEKLAGGDRVRTIEIADRILDANLGRVMADGARFANPALILPGWELRVPSDVIDAGVARTHAPQSLPRGDQDTDAPRAGSAEPGPTNSVEVVPGDTLSGLASRHLGDEHRWSEIWDLNRGRTMADGRRFDDPDLIVVGWTLRIPIPDEEEASPAAAPAVDDVPVGPAPIEENAIDTTHDVADTPADALAKEVSGDVDGTVVPSPPPSLPPHPGTPADHPAVSSSPSSRAAPHTGTITPTATASTTTSSSTVPAAADRSTTEANRAPSAPGPRSPIRYEHAAFLAGGLVALLGVRRRRRLRSAAPRSRVPPPRAENVATERRLRGRAPGEDAARVDLALRSAAARLRDVDAQVGFVVTAHDGGITVHLTGGADPLAPWTAEADTVWVLGADVSIEELAESARGVGAPCLALVQIAVDADGRDVLVDLEAAGSTLVEISDDAPDVADDVVRAIGLGVATSAASESVHVITVSMATDHLLGHPNAHRSESVEDALDLAESLVGSTSRTDGRTFELRARGTGGELWEPAVVLLLGGEVELGSRPLPEPGRGLAIVAATRLDGAEHEGVVTVAFAEGAWSVRGFGTVLDATPIGVSRASADEVLDLVGSAEEVDDVEPGGGQTAAQPAEHGQTTTEWYRPPRHDIVVSMIGPIDVSCEGRSGGLQDGTFKRAKAIELITWLATHRERSTRSAARAALWETDVRDATFSNVVSDARRGLARLVEPPDEEEWIARTLTDRLPLHELVTTDADLIEDRLGAARAAPSTTAIEVLTPAVESIRGVPFEGTSYLWPDADGLTSNLVLLATTAATELAGHGLATGDIDLVFWSTGQGLKVLPGHEELIGLRMRAHARAGDLAGVRQEWASYERVIVADTWSDGEPAPKLVALRRELLTS